jgi:co-chaperonin GroES (HSP10)
MVNIKQLREFLVKAKKAGYANYNAEKVEEKNKSKTITFKLKDWKYFDNYFGGEPYGGEEVVFFKDKPVYMMVYYGSVDNSIEDFKKVYKFLQNALLLIPKGNPFRGPKKYKQDDYVYINKFEGKAHDFHGEETILLKGKRIYEARYAGGLVDQRKEENA